MPISNTKKLFRSLLIVSVLLAFLSGCVVKPGDDGLSQSGMVEPKLPQPKALTDPREIEINNAIQKALVGREDVLGYIIFRVAIDHVDFSKDESLALAWISMVDKQTGLVQNSEPGLVIAHATGDPVAPWRVVFQADPDFAQELAAVPDVMLSAENKAMFMPGIQQQSKDGVVYRGYKLPWTKGQGVYLTGSIGHVFTYKSCPSTCLYAFDFANGSMFPIKAARHGYVKYVQWTYPNGNETNTNYIVLEDPSTTPTTYQVYYHLAQNSIPGELRVVGAEVMQGQFIGNADDTGYSTGNHLHFHVHTNPSSVWGNSVDIVFDEVAVNGGRPRTCSEANAYPEYGSQCVSGNLYYSNNGDMATPTGGITSPANYATITSPTINVSGWMQDDTAIASGQILYNTGGDWIAIGDPVSTSPFTREIDLCDSRIPDGKFFLSIEVIDQAGKVSIGNQGLIELTKAYTCAPLPPACSPAESQIAIYTETEYQGICQILDLGDYANLGSLANSYLDNVKSIQVGAGVTALVYPDVDFAGTLELFQDGDSNLADNGIGSMNAASIRVVNRIVPPEPPVISLPEKITASLNLTLAWNVVPGEQTYSSLTGPDGYAQTLDWQEGGAWNVGLLPEGTYQWTVEARNLAGSASITQEFSVEKAATAPISHMDILPALTNSSAVLLTWQVDQGAENIDHFEFQVRVPGTEWNDWPEKPGKDDRQMIYWGVPGQTVEFRLRAVDLVGNPEDYLSVTETATQLVATCIDDGFEGSDYGDDIYTSPSLIEQGATQTHNWCIPFDPSIGFVGGDTDWLIFTAAAGDSLRFTTKPVDHASAAILTLYEADALTFIGEARPADATASASLDWTAPVDGNYYLKLTPFDNRLTGTDTKYEVGIELKSKIQPATLICGSAAIPALLAGGYAVSKQVKRAKKAKQRKEAMGW